MNMDPILRHLPEEINTDRLRIRVPKKGDGEAVYTSIQRSKEELKKNGFLLLRRNRQRQRWNKIYVKHMQNSY